jgi:hypothetical protein
MHRHRDVRVADLFEWRIQISMSGSDLNASLKILIHAPVIDRNHVTTLQVRRDLIDGLEGCLIEPGFINLLVDEYEFVAVESYQLLRSITDQAHRHRVEQFIGKMDPSEWFQRSLPVNLIAKRPQHPALLLFQRCKWLDYPVAQRVKEFREPLLHELQNIPRELPIVRAMLDNHETFNLPEAFPDFGELRGKQLPKQRTHADVREIVTFATYHAAA